MRGLRGRAAARLGWTAWAVCLALALLNLVLNLVEPASLDPLLPRPFPPPVAVQGALTLMAFPTVGALIAARQPSNPIGWLLCGMAVTEALRGTAGSYARYAVLARPGSLPAGEWVAWVGSVAWGPSIGLLVLALLLFPDGKLVSRRWRPVGWVLGGACAAAVLVNGLVPENLSSLAGIARPFRVGGATGEALQVLSRGLALVQVVLLLAAGLSLVVRFRRAQGPERQQIKWVVLAGVLAAVGIVGFWLPGGWDWATTLGDWEYLAVVPYSLAVIAIPVASGVAILRHRLYDIDRLISRAFTYGVLWLGIALAYVGFAIGLGLAASERLPLALAIVCTIIAAVLFQPARRRLEQLADRWVFGERLGGYELMARLGTTLEHALGTDEVAPRVAATVRLGLRTRWVRVPVEHRTSEGTSLEPIGADGIGLDEPASPALSVPLVHGDKQIGMIECGPKQEGAFQATDRELLETLGRQAALAIRNAALAAELAERLAETEHQARELAASRTRIVQAEEAGRRRIERDIHDGVQQELVALLPARELAHA